MPMKNGENLMKEQKDSFPMVCGLPKYFFYKNTMKNLGRSYYPFPANPTPPQPTAGQDPSP
jgi:hypothetical protein